MGESIVRFLYGSPLPFRAPQPRYVATQYGYKLEPNQRTFIGDKPVVANEHGFRDHAWSMPKPASRRRILIVGDSMPFGYHVRFEDTFGKRLERKLKGSFPNSEVFVAAVSGWDTRTELEFLKTEGLNLGPELVILCPFLNDFDTPLPFSTSTVLGDPIDTRPRWSRWLPEESTLSLKRSALILFARTRFEWAIASLYDYLLGIGDRRKSVEDRLMEGADDDGTRLAISRMLALLGEIHDVVRAKRAELAIAFMPNYEIFHNLDGPPPFVRALQDFSHQRDVVFVDPTNEFSKHHPIAELYLRPWDNAHFSVAGHELVSEKLVAAVEPYLARSRTIE